MNIAGSVISKKIHVGDNFACPGGARTGYGYRTVRTTNMDKI
jgi:hypothetical protein